MKSMFFSLSFFLFSTLSFCQLKTSEKCPDINVDLLYGVVNGTILPTSNIALIKHDLPCFTSTEDKGITNKCGASVSYKDKDICFYTDRNYVEIGPDFKGKLSIPLMGAARDAIFKYLGAPEIKEATWEAFKTSYGILILYYNKENKINKIQYSTKSASTIQLCE
ncbi:MAG: hypothetical protein ABI359_04940 [Ginsengibacter sp.]